MEKQPVVALGLIDEPFQPVENVFLRCSFIDEDPDVFRREAEVLEEDIPHVCRVINVPAQVCAGNLVLVYPENFIRPSRVLSR